MIAPNLLNLYVDDLARSADFYQRLLTGDIVEQFPTFALFVFPNGFKLGLWGRTGLDPDGHRLRVYHLAM